MIGMSVKAALVVMAGLLAFIAAFCYDLGCSANTIRPGRGDVLITISGAAVAFTLLTALNVAFVHRRMGRRRARDEAAPGLPKRTDKRTKKQTAGRKGGKARRH